MIIKPALLGLALCGNASPDLTRVDRARANYEALMSGRKYLNQLTQQEQVDVLDFANAYREKPDTRSPSQRCVDKEIRRIGGTPSHLEQQVIDMKCRELGERIR